jgi:hypothetical protein
MRDGHAANTALIWLGKDLGMFKGGSAPVPPPLPRISDAERARALYAKYFASSDDAKTSTDKPAEKNDDL